MAAGKFDVHPAAAQWYRDRYPKDATYALEDTRTQIEEWDYEKDAHGYCHQRLTLIALVEEVERVRALGVGSHL